jgi:peptidoglycan/LPS O-acetylase OafA/YrhL
LLSLAVKSQPWIPLNVSEQGPGRFLVAGAATIVAASISWVVFERPLNSLKRHFPYVERARAAQAGHAGWLARAAGGSPDDRTPSLDLQRTDARR